MTKISVKYLELKSKDKENTELIDELKQLDINVNINWLLCTISPLSVIYNKIQKLLPLLAEQIGKNIYLPDFRNEYFIQSYGLKGKRRVGKVPAEDLNIYKTNLLKQSLKLYSYWGR